MAVRRAVFRIEEFLEDGPVATVRVPAAAKAEDDDLMPEVRRLRSLIEAKPRTPAPAPARHEVEKLRREIAAMCDAIDRTKQEIATIHVNGVETPAMARLADELSAVVTGTERATQTILQASETIETLAKAMARSAALSNDTQASDAARDVLDHITRIFEACNFQDLAGQRVSTVTATLKFIEEHLVRMMEIWGGAIEFREVKPVATFRSDNERLVNGPMLDGDDGHISQADIDAMFK